MGKKSGNGALLLIGGVVLLLVFAMGGFEGFSLSSLTDRGSGDFYCGDDGQADVDFRYRNVLNTTEPDYHSVDGIVALTLFDAETDRQIIDLTANNADGTYDTVANELECGKSYYVAVVDDANDVFVQSETKVADSSIVRFDIEGAGSSPLVYNLYTTAFGNLSGGAPDLNDFATNTNTALGTGGTHNFRYDVAATTVNAQFGSFERICESDTGVCGQAFVCITASSSIYVANDLSIDGDAIIGRVNTLPDLCVLSSPSNAGVGRAAFEVSAITNAMGVLDGTASVTSSLGNAADTDNVRFIWMENGGFIGQENTLKYGTADDSATDIGDANNYFEDDIT